MTVQQTYRVLPAAIIGPNLSSSGKVVVPLKIWRLVIFASTIVSIECVDLEITISVVRGL